MLAFNARRTAALAGVSLFTGLIAASVSARPPHGTGGTGKPVGLDVQPFPGTPDASPQTDVDFPTLSRSEIRSVRVHGSVTGVHFGRLIALRGHRGVEFVPDRPFVSGERVSAEAILSFPAAGTTSGAPGSTRIRFSFGVRAPLETPTAATTTGSGPTAGYAIRHDLRETRTWTHTFASNRRIHPPLVFTTGTEPDAGASGDIFTDVHRAFRQAGPLILDPQGQLIWFNPIPNRGAALNTEVQRYRGRDVLTYWRGYTGDGYGSGEDVILNHHYKTVATVRAGHGYRADLHEFRILPGGDALITAYAKVPHADLRSVGGPRNGTLLDSIIQEVNIATGHVDWEWHAYGHVRLRETYAGKPGRLPYDFLHINSIQLLPNGNLLVSARNTWTVYEINMKTGRIPYNFGGKNSSFKFRRGAHFAWQHDARMQPDGTMTVFDDGAGYYKSERQSRALRLRINYRRHSVSLVRSYTHNPPLLSGSQGSVQVLRDGNVFVAWGSRPYLTEFSKQGRQLFSMHYHSPMENYRGYRFRWWGQPSTRPNLAVASTKRGTTVAASWNGATDVASWRVLAGSSRTGLSAIGMFPWAHFETKMLVQGAGPYFAVQALGPGGGVRATSRVVRRGSAG